MAAISAIAATLVFVLFDLWLFPWAVNSYWLGWYRALQTVVQIGLYALAWMLGGWTAAVAAAVIWWLGGCDVLFYWIGGYPWHKARWPWLWWTPAGLWRWIPVFLATKANILERAALGRDAVTLTGTGVLWQAGIGLALAAAVIVLL